MKNPFKKEDKEKKRGAYKKQECPYCHKLFGNLQNHVKLAHPTEAPPAEPPAEISAETLLGGKKPPAPESKAKDYYCNSCHAELRKGETPCWNCGAGMVWEGIE